MPSRRCEAVYAGSFDPPTLGHLDIIERAARLFSTIHVAVAHNNDKNCLLSSQERLQLLNKLCASLPNVKTTIIDGLVIDYMTKNGIIFLVRGLRGGEDVNAERNLSSWNSGLYPGVDTVFLLSSPKFMHISSSGVKAIINMGGDFSAFVPKIVHRLLTKKIKHCTMAKGDKYGGSKVKNF